MLRGSGLISTLNGTNVPVLDGKVDQVPRTCTAGLRKETKAREISNSLPLGLALGSPIFPSGCEGKLGVALESLQGLRDLLLSFLFSAPPCMFSGPDRLCCLAPAHWCHLK